MKRVACLIGTLAVLATAPASAQDACAEYGRGRIPVVGKWAEYQMTAKKDEPTTLRWAIVGTEERKGRSMHWFEMAMEGEKAGKGMVMKVLVPGFPYEPAGMEEMVMQPEGKQAMQVSGAMLKMMRGQMGKNSGTSLAQECAKAKLIGEESVTVPAGTFRTKHYRDDKGTDIWLGDASPFGVVKSTGKDFEFVLVETGGDAKSAITGEIKAMPGMGMPGS